MWLLQANVGQTFEQAQRDGLMPTAQQQLEYEARFSDASADGSTRLLTIAGSSAEIAIQGAITNRPSMFAYLFGGGNTTYPDIIAALAAADQNPNVKDITLAIDSPGGTIAGLFDALAAIEATTKPTRAVVNNLAASAAYALAAKADSITATNRAACFGSVGIVVSGYSDPAEFAITSTEAPKKAPDVRTAEGQAMIREELDALHEIFVEAIASGRDTTVDSVNATYGQGGVLLADEALKRGMIDTVGQKALTVVLGTKSTKPEASKMDLNQLKAEHPDVYAAAMELGAAGERDRVSAHITMGAASGDMTTALAAIADGSGMTATLQATYMAAGMNRRDNSNRQADDAAAAAAADGARAPAADAGEKAGAAILNAAAALCNVELEA